PEENGEHDAGRDVLAEAAVYALEKDVEPAIEKPFAAQRARDVATLVRCMDRRRRYGAALGAIACEEMAALLGTPPESVEAGNAALVEGIREERFDDASLVPYLARKAWRDEWLHQPAVDALYPGRRWSALD
nr:hypothetical protein [Myxococcota bacterium]